MRRCADWSATMLANPLLVLPFLALLPVADCPDRAATSELHGTWRLVSLESGGQVSEMGLGQPWVEFDGDTMRYGGEVIAKLTSDAATMPKIIDFHFARPTRVFEGIYSLDGDTLRVCLTVQLDGVKERPHLLDTRGKDNWRLLKFVRDEPEVRDGSDQLPGYVGFAGLNFDEERHECTIDEVRNASPAQQAGLKQGDIIVKVSNQELTDLESLIDAVRRTSPCGRIVFRIRRDGAERDVTVRVGFWPFEFVVNLP
jgi:uncharacterized protein (TIGR03067 family)